MEMQDQFSLHHSSDTQPAASPRSKLLAAFFCFKQLWVFEVHCLLNIKGKWENIKGSPVGKVSLLPVYCSFEFLMHVLFG